MSTLSFPATGKWCLLVALLTSLYGVPSLPAQALRTLDHADFAIWKNLEQPMVAANGSHVAYRLVPGEGDGELCLYDVASNATSCLPRVKRAALDEDGQFLYGLITPHRDSLRALERRKVEKKQWPPDTLFIRRLEDGATVYVPHVKDFSAPAKAGDWLAYSLAQEALHGDSTMKSRKLHKDLYHLVVRQLSTGTADTLLCVKEHVWADEAPALCIITGEVDSLQAGGAWHWQNRSLRALRKEKAVYAKPAISDDGRQASFVGHTDTTGMQIVPWQLYYSAGPADSARIIAQPDERILSQLDSHRPPVFSGNGQYLFYGRMPLPWVRDTSLLADEWVDVEVWSTQDPVLYTVQNKRRADDEKRSYVHVYDTRTQKHMPAGDNKWESAGYSDKRNGRYILLWTERPYSLRATWEGEVPKDIEAYDLQTGKRIPIAREMVTFPRLSPDGAYAYGFNEADTVWWAFHLPSATMRTMKTEGLPPFYDELHDTPNDPGSYGSAGWTSGDHALVLYDRYDLWRWAPLVNQQPERLTKGRETNRIHRYIRTDPEEVALSDDQPWLLHLTDDPTKASGYGWLNPITKSIQPEETGPYAYSRQVRQSRNGDAMVFSRENFQTFPDLRLSRDRLASSIKISDANPQQKEYAWGTIELYHWMDWDSVRRTGLLVKPAGFDTLRSYPTLVNFYERSSDGLHNYPQLFPHRSTINYAFYASRGYVIFNPDIAYETGLPGESAYKIVMSGVTSLFKDRIADPNHIGLQGHSWGGYQIAYIVSRTNIFTCAESGAPVVNMTSAYGGIRWESGMSRMFQYEKQQSRLGKTLWEDPQRYLDNSPLFKAHKIETPLLIMHNDEDGAVPFEQGIEFYMALRRLGKKAWLLNYRGEPHWPIKWHQRKDFQLRMSQFFDHYLKEAPIPAWMEQGIPAVQRGVRAGYETDRP